MGWFYAIKRLPRLSFRCVYFTDFYLILYRNCHNYQFEKSIGNGSFLEKLNFVNGVRVKPKYSKSTFVVEDPATGKKICDCLKSTVEDVEEAIKSAVAAQNNWAALSGFERGKILTRAADIIRQNVNSLARIEVLDNGKPIYEAEIDIAGCADTFAFYGGIATTIMGDFIPLSGFNFAYTRREPVGVVAGIGAWNYPFQVISWKAAPALCAGNAIVFKPSPLTPLTAVLLMEILTEAGIPPGVISVVQGDHKTGESLCVHPSVNKVSFTGSVPTGRRIMAICADRGPKHVTLELGGKSPLIIFDDAPLENAASGAMLANFLSQGQVCSNAARVFIHRSKLAAFTESIVKRVRKNLKVGDPMIRETTVGAMISSQHLQKVKEYIKSARQEGGEILCGGGSPSAEQLNERCRNGHYLEPCVVTNVNDHMRIVREEIFGPVMAILPFDTEEEVLRRANDTEFGLAAGIFTNDLQRAHRVVAKLQAGTIYVNTYNVTPVEMPFGGIKHSGFGRECGLEALKYYTNCKSVLVETSNCQSPI